MRRLLSLLRDARGSALQPAVGSASHDAGKSTAAPRPNAGARFGDYEILEVLGHSPNGVMSRARAHRLARQVALKTPDPAAPDFPAVCGSLEAEARVLAVTNHPNVQDVCELGEEQGVPFMAAELVTGTSLKSAIETGMALEDGLRVVVQVLSGLAAVHRSGVAHGSIEPTNIVIQDNGRVKIVGFDLARPFQFSASTGGRVSGAPAYMSPERA